MTTIDTAPAFAPPASDECQIVVHQVHTASCQTHGVAELGHHRTRRVAQREFLCDQGTGWRFMIEYEPGYPPLVVDLAGLVTRVHADTAAAAIGMDDGEPATIWRWVGEGRTEPITVQKVPGTGDWVPNPNDERTPLTAYPEYTITGPDGTEFARVTVAVDGAA
jgi:hypothetical protein